MPSKFTINFLKSRYWRKFKININQKKKLLLKKKIKLAAIEMVKKSQFSSCLSRSTICMIFLEIFGLDVDLFLGMHLSQNNTKTPHCWIKLKENNENITYQIRNCSTIIKI